MSSYIAKAKKKSTGEIFEVHCLDDYFGRHKYGYCVMNGEDLTLMEPEFDAKYEIVKESLTPCT